MHGPRIIDWLGVKDDVLPEEQRRELNQFLREDNDKSGWKFGWKSSGKTDVYSFWHRHFAGYTKSGGDDEAYDCSAGLKLFPLIEAFWQQISATHLPGHRLIRCYANGHTYGSDGTLHTDTALQNTYTTLYYPHPRWAPNWGGDTIFFNEAKNDILAAVYPRPNRLITFDGRVPHVARGVSRECPALRVTLMFKTDKLDATG